MVTVVRVGCPHPKSVKSWRTALGQALFKTRASRNVSGQYDGCWLAYMNFVKEYWDGLRPYLLKIAIDFSVSGSLYLGLYLFRGLTHFLPVSGWAGIFIEHLHSAGIVIAFGVFAILSVIDIIRIRISGRKELLCLV